MTFKRCFTPWPKGAALPRPRYYLFFIRGRGRRAGPRLQVGGGVLRIIHAVIGGPLATLLLMCAEIFKEMSHEAAAYVVDSDRSPGGVGVRRRSLRLLPPWILRPARSGSGAGAHGGGPTVSAAFGMRGMAGTARPASAVRV
jgi:hypothetical protein